MSQQNTRRRNRHVQVGIPAALLSTLSGAFAVAPAAASEVPTGVLERTHAVGSRALPTTAPGAATHTVQAGETVWAIARQHGLRSADLVAWNGLGADALIRPGQVLRLTPGAAPASTAPAPAPAPAAQSYTVVAGDTITRIASKHGTTINAVLAANGLSRSSVIYPGQQLRISGVAAPASAPAATPASAPAPTADAATSHTVVAGDTISAIAKKYATSVSAVLAANGLTGSSIIYPGQKIAIPGTRAAQPASVPALAPTDHGPQNAVLNAPQTENALMIIRIGRELGVSDRGIAIALATSMVESWLRNLDWGDRDSLGLFQQRPSTGWGTAEEIRNRDYAIRTFYTGNTNPDGTMTHGLLDVSGWESMRFTDAAQAVQKSAFPERYGQWEQAAHQWLAQLG
ncbi:LysM peptidoglycan-binding domain-containing protein [Microbacterium sp. M28]|uniref:LysM peptidoglycan-binding domain-containing protein n=1 Tax=Microbacterium sp. M28 TaxID=2962064 RepID=UPI0021F4BF93|nr:LysM peptidoglycan-binding domain-containing protein [Microbacterium sp. M28]UYO95935.1 LysM peptidoglycan-binding domain-containing protein [Microbacterium sp. M28]